MIGKDTRRGIDKQLSNVSNLLASFYIIMKNAHKLFRLPFHISSTCKINVLSAHGVVGRS